MRHLSRPVQLLKPDPIPEQCSFCRHAPPAVKRPGVAICANCIRKYVALLKDPEKGESTEPFHHCYFCGFLRSSMPIFSELPGMAEFTLTEKEKGMLEEIYDNQFPGHKCPAGEAGTRLIRRHDVTICDECLRICEASLAN